MATQEDTNCFSSSSSSSSSSNSNDKFCESKASSVKNDPEEDNQETNANTHIVATHYNELKERGRIERFKSRILYLRNFNNWIKSQLIIDYTKRVKAQKRVVGTPIRVLDIGCGRGGDLLKWEKANINHLICTDLAEVSIEHCKRRYREMHERMSRNRYAKPFTAEFLACDSTLVRLRERYMDASLKLDLVSCQFAFHYSFESLSQADCMVRNCAECLEEDGYFIATIPDAYEIMKRLHQSTDKRKFGNDLYSIEFLCETDPPPLFGAKYQFKLDGVVDCPEFLVYTPLLINLCRNYGLKLECIIPFNEYFKRNLERGRTLLERMNALEAVRPNRLETKSEYEHVKRKLKGGNSGRAFGTLSQSEWEAASLYLVCAFKKVHTDWDSEGKPLYKFDD